MKTTGIVRNLDELGRIVIPKSVRKAVGFEAKDPIEIYLEEKTVILKRYHNSCIFCGSDQELTDFENKKICKKCLKKIERKNNK